MHRRLVALVLLALLTACHAPPTARIAVIAPGDGVCVHLLRIRITPAHTARFEALMTRCVTAATEALGEADDGDDWLCYREPPGRYWLVTFADTPDRFAFPETLEGFVDAVGDLVGDGISFRRDLATIEYDVEWDVLMQQRQAWCTVADMSTDTHPNARIMRREVRSGQEAMFDRALTDRTRFLEVHDYPLPIEGFVTLRGTDAELQVVYPRAWPEFHATESFGAFVAGLDESSREQYARRKQRLMRTMSNADYYDGSFAPRLSYGGA